MMSKIKILVVGQTPPPFGGQAIMIDEMLKGRYNQIQFFHVRMAFSKEMDEIGKFQISKLFHLIEVVFRIIYVRFYNNVEVLYYPPASANKVPFYRDVVILLLTRPFFRKVVFHFHAAGISNLYSKLSFFSRWLFRKTYYYADLGIRLSSTSPDDCKKLMTKSEVIIPNGIEDFFSKVQFAKLGSPEVRILFVGVIMELKGISILVDSCDLLKRRDLKFSLKLMGKFESLEYEMEIRNKIQKYGLEKEVVFCGVLTGHQKFSEYVNSDIFCFPSYIDNFPVVLLEASCFGLPMVSTKCGGIPSIIENEKNGFMVTVGNSAELAEKLELLILDSGLRMEMGDAARRMYLQSYTMDKFFLNIEKALTNV